LVQMELRVLTERMERMEQVEQTEQMELVV
jgi:hypothetical protein